MSRPAEPKAWVLKGGPLLPAPAAISQLLSFPAAPGKPSPRPAPDQRTARLGSSPAPMETQSQSFRVAEDTQDFQDTAGQTASTSGRGDVELLRQAVMNEKAAPELLQFETDLISRIEAMVDYQVRGGEWEEVCCAGEH